MTGVQTCALPICQDAYLHDEIATDKRNPTINANGLIYGSPEDSTDFVPILDPVRHVASEVKHPVRDEKTPSSLNDPYLPSAYWGNTPPWDSKAVNHNPMLDEKGRLWVAETPEYPNGRRAPNTTVWKDTGSLRPGQTQREPEDRISILTDTDGDGIMDKKQVFADKLELVTSFEIGRAHV